MASRRPLRPRAGSTQRGLQPRAVRGEICKGMVHLQAIFDSPLVQAAHPQIAKNRGGAAEPVAGGEP
eukprot:2631940-Prymnesium_polylepis.1